jgi:phosphoribosylformylglycinamidine synthase
MYQAKIHVTLRKSVLDTQGAAVIKSLQGMGYDNVSQVQVGRLLVVDIDAADRAAAEDQVRQMCEKLLVNLVMEDYTFTLLEV